MPFLLRNLTLLLGEGEDILPEKLTARLSISRGQLAGFAIARKGVDARRKGRVKFVYTIEFRVEDEEAFKRAHLSDPDIEFREEQGKVEFPRLATDKRLLITGMGPAGLFAALRLTEYGLAPVLIERGKPMEERVRDVRTFWGEGLLDPESNVQFGEGGAGTFSDGTTLTTQDLTRLVTWKSSNSAIAAIK